jgi:small-conductance mechanosensitive channel
MTGANVQLTDRIWRTAQTVLLAVILIVFGPGLQAEPFSALTGGVGGGSSAEGGGEQTEPETDPAARQQALEKAIALLEDDQARQALLEDLRALQQGLRIEEEATAEGSQGILTALSVRMNWISGLLTLEPVLNRWHLLLQSTAEDLQWLLSDPDGRRRLVAELMKFFLLLGIAALITGLGWLLLRYPARRLRGRDRQSLAASVACVPFMASFAVALVLMPTLGAAAGTRLAVATTYVALGGAGLFLVATLLLSLAEHGRRRRLVRLLLPRVRPWLIGIGGSLAAADAFSNQWVAEPLGGALPSLLSTWLYLLTALLCGLLAFRHHRLATMILRLRGRESNSRNPLWLTAGQVAAQSWQWAVIVVSAMSFLGILFLQGEEQTILQAGVISALTVVATTLAVSLTSAWIRLVAKKLKAPPRRSYYLARYMSLVRVLVCVAIWALGIELILLAWGSSLTYFFENVIGDALAGALVSLLLIALLGWTAWITLKTAIERALAGESQNLQSQSARSRTLLPLLRSVGLVLILVIAVITALSSLGVNVTPLLAGAGVLGLAIGFGSQKLVQDLITGLFILFEDTISLGDYIQVAGHEGIVEGLSVRTVRMRDLNGTLHAVPFGEITSVRNLSKDYAYALMEITVSFKEDVDEIIRELEEIGEELRKDPILGWDILEPLEVFGLQKFTTDGMVVRVRFMTRPLRQWDVMRGYNLRIKRRFDELGIQLPVQQVMVHQAEGTNFSQGKSQAPAAQLSQASGPLGTDEP